MALSTIPICIFLSLTIGRISMSIVGMCVNPHHIRLLGGSLICKTMLPSKDLMTTARMRSTTMGLNPVGMVAVVAMVRRNSEFA